MTISCYTTDFEEMSYRRR